MSVSRIMECRACQGSLVPILSLGDQYVIDYPRPGEPNGLKAPLNLVQCENCALVQLEHSVSQDRLFKNFWYLSGLSKTMSSELAFLAKDCGRYHPLSKGDIVVDIGSNDGTLLSCFPDGVTKLGFEPALNMTPKEPTIPDYFSAEKYPFKQKAEIITSVAMFYDLPDPNSFLDDVSKVVADDGLFVIQQNYLLSMLSNIGFDNIVHEHLEYYHLQPLEQLLEKHGLHVFDAELNGVNGGSLRTYISKRQLKPSDSLRLIRRNERVFSNLSFEHFTVRVKDVKHKLQQITRDLLGQGKKIYVLGAGTRGNTILQYAGLDHHAIIGAVDRNSAKWGHETAGGRIPIMERAKANPDYFLVLPTHFLREFQDQEKDWLGNGGRFIVPIPEARIL